MAKVLQDLREAMQLAGLSMALPQRAATPTLSAHVDVPETRTRTSVICTTSRGPSSARPPGWLRAWPKRRLRPR
eukprot:3806899-Lingulodinium_polyedra.AAC.1